MLNFKSFLNESNLTVINECYRIGELSPQMDFHDAGGIWFSEKEIDVINYHITRKEYEKRKTNTVYKCELTFQNPKYFVRFWEGENSYLTDVREKINKTRHIKALIKDGYDSIIIDKDIWNDTGDKYQSSNSKQFVAFNYNQVHIISKKIIKYEDYILDDPTPEYLKDFMNS
jgi:hypothetical protein